MPGSLSRDIQILSDCQICSFTNSHAMPPEEAAAEDLPPHDIEDISPKNTREYISHMSPEIRVVLENFYAPFNKKLFALIGKDLDSW